MPAFLSALLLSMPYGAPPPKHGLVPPVLNVVIEITRIVYTHRRRCMHTILAPTEGI